MVKAKKKSVKVGKMVNTNHVNSVVRNYKLERWVHNSKRLGKEDSLSVWYSIDELEEFFREAKSQGADGVRMYFGAYDQHYPENPLFAGRQTIVLAATKSRDTSNGIANKDLYISRREGSSILAYNAGMICPPICTGEGGAGITLVDKQEEGIIVA